MFDVEFKIVSNKNPDVYTEGYVTVYDEEAEDVDWYYWTGNGYQSHPYYHHDAERIIGLTDKQNEEIDQFKIDYEEDSFWIDNVIEIQSEGSKKTYVRENCTLIINGGE